MGGAQTQPPESADTKCGSSLYPPSDKTLEQLGRQMRHFGWKVSVLRSNYLYNSRDAGQLPFIWTAEARRFPSAGHPARANSDFEMVET